MRVVLEARACSVLRNLLLGAREGTFLLPANVCPVVPLTFQSLGRSFEFIDIDPEDLCMSRTAVQARLAGDGPAVAGVVYVRTYGYTADLSGPFAAWKRAHPGLLLIDDRCPGRPDVGDCDGQGADVVLFSTGYGKYVDLGFGGYAFVSDDVDYVRSDRPFVANDAQRLEARYKHHIEMGTTMDCPPGTPGLSNWIPSAPLEVSVAAYLDEVRRRLEPVAEHKARINEIYRRLIPESIQLDPSYSHWRFQVRAQDKHGLLSRIFRSGHFASGHYYPASRLFDHQPCAAADDLYEEVVNLFNDFAITPAAASAVAEVVASHAGH